jgi:hypothetical protein
VQYESPIQNAGEALHWLHEYETNRPPWSGMDEDERSATESIIQAVLDLVHYTTRSYSAAATDEELEASEEAIRKKIARAEKGFAEWCKLPRESRTYPYRKGWNGE